MSANFHIFRTIAMLLVLSAMAGIAAAQPGRDPAKSGTKQETNSSGRRTSSRALALKRAKAEQEKRRRKQAEKQAAETSAAQAEAEQERRRREQAEKEAADARAAQAEAETRRRDQAEKQAAETRAAQAEAEHEKRRREHAEKEAAEARAQAGAEHERRRREQAEKEAAEARAAQERAERESRENRVVWLVTIINNTRAPVPYEIFEQGTWVPFTLPPGYQLTHTGLKEYFTVKYDYKYEAGYQEQQFNLPATPVVGHEPTETEKATAKVYYFEVNSEGTIGLYPKSN